MPDFSKGFPIAIILLHSLHHLKFDLMRFFFFIFFFIFYFSQGWNSLRIFNCSGSWTEISQPSKPGWNLPCNWPLWIVNDLHNRCSYTEHFYCFKLPFCHRKLHFVSATGISWGKFTEGKYPWKCQKDHTKHPRHLTWCFDAQGTKAHNNGSFDINM